MQLAPVTAGVPVITVTGWSNSGKTTFFTKVVEILTASGYNIGVIKHHGHKADTVDQKGKDSWKYAQAGANPVVLSSALQYAIFRSTPQGEVTRDELIARIGGEVDFVIVEGFRADAEGAVELSRLATGKGPKLAPEERIAVITDNPDLAAEVAAEGKPVFGLEDHAKVARYFCQLAGIDKPEINA